MSLPSRIKAVLVEEELQQADEEYPVPVHVGLHRVPRYDDLPERVADLHQRSELLLPLLLVVDAIGGLDVRGSAALPGDEIHLSGDLRHPPVDAPPESDHSDIHHVSSGTELVVDDVLHDVRPVGGLTEVHPRIGDPVVHGIVFGQRSDAFPSFDVVPSGLLEQEGVLQVADVPDDRILGGSSVSLGCQGVLDLGRIHQGAGGRGQHIDDVIQQIRPFDPVALLYILQIHSLHDRCEIRRLLFISLELHESRQSAIVHVLGQGFRSVAVVYRAEFRE